jgi:hypothetical protein
VASLPLWDARISTDKVPFAGPSVAVNLPSYEMNSTTAPLFTSAIASGDPFWMPFTA